jgi:N-methylhydantoinase B
MVGTISNALCPYLLLLCHDIPWSAGAWKPVKFIIPEGTWINPRPPAATSCNTPQGGGYLVIGTVHDAVSKMLLSCEKLRYEAFAGTADAVQAGALTGVNKDGTIFATTLMESIAGGMGALANGDGENTSSNMWTPKSQIVNLETNELLFPWLYLFRKEIVDTGGAGRFRGGTTSCTCLIPWDALSKQLTYLNLGFGVKPRIAAGLAGGYPAPNTQAVIIRNSDIIEKFRNGEFPREPKEIKGEAEILPPLEDTVLNEKDVIYYYQSGGGGYGDPITRDPNLVLEDIKAGYTSLDFARDVYGVIIDPDRLEIELGRTEQQRKKIIEKRLKVGKK